VTLGEDIEGTRSEGARAFVFVDSAAADPQPIAAVVKGETANHLMAEFVHVKQFWRGAASVGAGLL
jgi:hypothetical protein